MSKHDPEIMVDIPMSTNTRDLRDAPVTARFAFISGIASGIEQRLSPPAVHEARQVRGKVVNPNR